jgi:hypothetical protein
VRIASQERRKRDGQKYKKGYEVRIIVKTAEELRRLRACILLAGFKPGSPYKKRKRIVQPIYGKSAVDWFLTTRVK